MPVVIHYEQGALEFLRAAFGNFREADAENRLRPETIQTSLQEHLPQSPYNMRLTLPRSVETRQSPLFIFFLFLGEKFLL